MKRYPRRSRAKRLLQLARRIFQIEDEIRAKRLEFDCLLREPDMQLALPFPKGAR
jgi:hypothetical protein